MFGHTKIGDDKPDRLLLEYFKGLVHARGEMYVVLLLQQHPKGLPRPVLIIDDEDVRI